MSGMSPVRVAILSDHSLLRDSLGARLAEEEGLEVVAMLSEVPTSGLAPSLGAADVVVAHRSSIAPTVLAPLALGDGVEKPPRVLLLLDDEDEQLVVEGLRYGTSGFVSTYNSVDDLVSAILGVADGETRIPPRLLPRVIEALQRGAREVDEAGQRLALLTERERQILDLLAEGRDRMSIAQELFISVNTVRTHAGRILTKLGVDSQLRAVSMLLAARAGNGTTDPPPLATWS